MIIHLQRDAVQQEVEVSFSRDATFQNLTLNKFPLHELMESETNGCFFRIPKKGGIAGCAIANNY